MATIIAIANQKGGVGKSTTAVTLAAIEQQAGKRVLLIDSDSQKNSTDTLQAKSEGEATLYDLLTDDETTAEECIQHTGSGIDIIAGDALLRDVDTKLTGVSGAYQLSERIQPITDKYDLIVIDCPPALNVLLTGALTAATHVLVPVTADRYSVSGFAELTKTINEIRKYTNRDLKVAGVFVTRYTRSTLSSTALQALPELAKQLQSEALQTVVRETVRVREAQGARETLISWAPDCNAAQDYMALAAELRAKEVL